MSQLVSRPGTQQSLMGRLPEIQHPLSRLGSITNLDVRGMSRDGDRPVSHEGGRPLGSEGAIYSRRSSRASRSRPLSQSLPEAPLRHASIPEGMPVTHGDLSKPRIPIFGNRADVNSRAEVTSRLSSRQSRASAHSRLEIDELEAILKEKVPSYFLELKKKFKDNDPEQKGNVSREALLRILMTFTNRPINQSQYSRLLERLGLQEKLVITFPEFYSIFREVPSAEFPNWVDPIQRHRKNRPTYAAGHVHAQLRDRTKHKSLTLSDLAPRGVDGSPYIVKFEFRNVLDSLGFCMEDEEFNKLWSKYDSEGLGSINGENLMKKLGAVEVVEPNTALSPVPEKTGSREFRKKEVERRRSLNIERWLKDKLREGFLQMKAALVACDDQKTGLVAHDDFLKVLCEFGLKLEKDHMGEFLARCNVQPTRTHVPYREFLHSFQDRSESGVAHKILTNPKHRYNRAESPDAMSTLSALETQVLNMFQKDFLALLGIFHKIDRHNEDVISQEEFRAAIESRFDLELSEDQFSSFIDRVSLDKEGNVRYTDFMAQFDARGKAKSLFTVASHAREYKPVPVLPEDKPSMPAPAAADPDVTTTDHKIRTATELVVEPDTDKYQSEIHPRRSPQEMFRIIKDLLKRRFSDVEQTFYEIDDQNTRRLSQETMYHLMMKFPIEPEFTRGEIRDLWRTFITNKDRTLDFHQFTRHFGFSIKSASFPNAKIVPPRRGDSDFLVRSRKLNCAADMLQDNLRSKIDYMWDDLRREFVAMDPYATGFVSADEFRELLSELCVQLTVHELDMLTKKYNIQNDDRVSYIEFLKPFAARRQTWRHGNNMLSLLQHPMSELPFADIVEPPQKGLDGITAKLRQKISNGWKNLRRAFKKLDINNEGVLSVPEFRSVLKLANIVLDEEEVYQILSVFDEQMTGKISYNRFLSDVFMPEKRRESTNLLRGSAKY